MTAVGFLQGVWAFAGPIVGAGGAGVWTWLSARAKARAEATPHLLTAAAKFQEALTAEAERLTRDLAARITHVEEQNARLEERCRRSEDRCDAAELAHEGCRAEVAELRRQLEERAFGPPPPPYTPGAAT